MMKEEHKIKMEEGAADEWRPEESDGRVLRVAARFFRLCLEEDLTPYEKTVAWKRVAVLLMEESPSEVTTRAMMRLMIQEMGLMERVVFVSEEGGK
jgi:hypothetical protein